MNWPLTSQAMAQNLDSGSAYLDGQFGGGLTPRNSEGFHHFDLDNADISKLKLYYFKVMNTSFSYNFHVLGENQQSLEKVRGGCLRERERVEMVK